MAALDLNAAVRQLKSTVRANAGANVADAAFEKAVDDLISSFYDDIGELTLVPLNALFDLFLIKTLYINRRSRDADVLSYLGEFLTRYLFAQELFPIQRGGRSFLPYLSDIMEEHTRATHFQNLFEAHRKFAENALFITGMFPHAITRRRRWSSRGRAPAIPSIDRSSFIRNGRSFYRMAAQHELAEVTGQRQVLLKLSTYFEVYMEALNEMSERYILGLDMALIADKMLDCFNRYRRTGDERALVNARKYAALLKLDQSSFPKLIGSRRSGRPVLLQGPDIPPRG